MADGLPALDQGGFAEALDRSTVPLVVDFWAPWCGPCRSTMPVFAQLAKEMDGRATFATVNVDVSPSLARQYDVRAIPTILVFTGGQLVGRAVGGQTAEQLRQLVNARS